MSFQGNPSINRRFTHNLVIDNCRYVLVCSDNDFDVNDLILIICQPMGIKPFWWIWWLYRNLCILRRYK